MTEQTPKRKLEDTIARITIINSSNDNDLIRLSNAGNQRRLARAYELYRGLSKKEYKELFESEKRKADAAKHLSWAGYFALANRQVGIRNAWQGWDHGSGYDKICTAFCIQDCREEDLVKNGENYLKMQDKFGNHSPLLTQPLFPYGDIKIEGLSFDVKSGRTTYTPEDSLMTRKLTALGLLECNASLMIGNLKTRGNAEGFILSMLKNLIHTEHGKNELFLKFRYEDSRHYNSLSIYGEEPKSNEDLPLAKVISPEYTEQKADLMRDYSMEGLKIIK